MKNLLYLPIDERFATRGAFLNLAELTPFNIITPPLKILPQMKKAPDMNLLHS